MPYLMVLILSVTLAPPFGEAEATAVDQSSAGLELEVAVEVDIGAAAVLARVVSRGGTEYVPVALVDEGSGVWRGTVVVPARDDLRMGFEIIPSGGGEATVSAVRTLVDLGVDSALLGTPSPTVTAAPLDEDGADGWAWVGIAAAAAALIMLAVWVVAGRRSGSGDHPTDVAEPETPEAGEGDPAVT